MDFGSALESLKRGQCVARIGWNGKKMFLTLQEGSIVNGEDMRNQGAQNYYKGHIVHICPHIDMKAADGSYVVGWLASQTDLLAEDWVIVKPEEFREKTQIENFKPSVITKGSVTN